MTSNGNTGKCNNLALSITFIINTPTAAIKRYVRAAYVRTINFCNVYTTSVCQTPDSGKLFLTPSVLQWIFSFSLPLQHLTQFNTLCCFSSV